MGTVSARKNLTFYLHIPVSLVILSAEFAKETLVKDKDGNGSRKEKDQLDAKQSPKSLKLEELSGAGRKKFPPPPPPTPAQSSPLPKSGKNGREGRRPINFQEGVEVG